MVDGKTDEAERLFQNVLIRSPDETAALLGLADIAYSTEILPQLKVLLSRALEIEPGNAAVQTAMGRFQFLSGNPEEALINFEEAIRLDPNLAGPEIELASLYLFAFNNLDGSAQHYARAVELDADNIKIRYAYASVLSKLSELDMALQQLEMAENLNPDAALTFQITGTILVSHAQHKRALDAFNKAISLDPINVQAYWPKAEIYMALKEYDNALMTYEKILSLLPSHALVLTEIGFLYQLQDNFEQAEGFYKKAIKIDPSMALAFNNLAFGATTENGREDEAIRWAQKALELQPDNPEFLDTLALTYESKGDLSKAQETLESLVEKLPSFLDGKYRLARMYDQKGDVDAAVQVYKSILRTGGHSFPEAKDIHIRLAQLGY